MDWLLGVVALIAGAMGAGAMSCVFKFDATSCDDYPQEGCPGVGTSTGGGGTGGTGTTSSSSSSSGGGGGGTGGSTPASCIPSEDPKVAVDDTCGVFVSATGSDTTGNGTKNEPFQSLAAAINKAKTMNRPVYACAEAFTEKVSVPAGVEIYGGLDCAILPRKWTYIGDMQKTAITALAGEIPVTLEKGAGTLLADLHVKAAAGVAAGESSIAVVADKVTADITRCTFEAAAGADGSPGALFGTQGQSGVTGQKGGDACSAAIVNGGTPVSSMCAPPDSQSGAGGTGMDTSALPGGSGKPSVSANGGTEDGGGGCTNGKKGADGSTGGSGAGATGIGGITNKGYTGITGSEGQPGGPGQGGGGGGGRIGGSGTNKCSDPASAGGAAGGSGGSGGCGGAGGKGGTSGGSSIALISLDSKLTFVTVTLLTANGGKGGAGGLGQDGGLSGAPGAGGSVPGTATLLVAGCPGGQGGQGGPGGQGGGGIGGHSIGIAYTGTAPVASSAGTWTATPGTAGNGGLGDNAMGNPGDGATGTAAPMQVFQ